MAIICNTIHELDAFTYNAGSKCFTVEASDFNGRFIASQVYDDACDEGFVIHSPSTGREILFVGDGVDRDSEGDIAGWRFKATKERQRNGLFWFNTAFDFTALIIND